MRMRLPAVSDAYRLAWRGTRHLPAPVGYGLAHTVADALWAGHRLRRSSTGVGQLERNLSRILPPGTSPRALRRAARAGMRSYMRYFYEAFALPGITPEQILARVRADVDPQLREDVRAGSVVMAATVPYARARAESIGATASVGIAERTDRLLVALGATFIVGLGAPQWVLTIGLLYVAVASFITVIQRVRTVHQQSRQAGDLA